MLVTKELKRIDFVNEFFTFMEDEYIDKEFHGPCRYGETLKQFYSVEEKDQVGTQITARIYNALYTYLRYEANKLLAKHESPLRIVTERLEKPEDETLSYDLVFTDTFGNLYKIEIKLSQLKNRMQGSTSSTNKVPHTLLINFEIDRDLILKEGRFQNRGLVKGVFAMLVDLSADNWVGAAKNNSHRTNLEFRIGAWDLTKLREESILVGDLKPARKLYHMKRMPLIHSDKVSDGGYNG